MDQIAKLFQQLELRFQQHMQALHANQPRVGQQLGAPAQQHAFPLGQHDAELGQHGPHLVDRRCALANPLLAHPVLELFRLVFGALHRHRPHILVAGSLTDRARVLAVVLLAPVDQPRNLRRWDQPDLVTHRRELPPPVVGRRAGLHRKLRRVQRPDHLQQLVTPHPALPQPIASRI